MGLRPKRPLVDELSALGVRELHALARRSGQDLPGPAVLISLESRPASTLLPQSRVVFVLCPRCGSRRRTLYFLEGQLACRRCFGLAYQSQTHGRWHRPLLERMAERTDQLARKRGPKGRRYRACLRRYRRVDGPNARRAPEVTPRCPSRAAPCLAMPGLALPCDAAPAGAHDPPASPSESSRNESQET